MANKEKETSLKLFRNTSATESKMPPPIIPAKKIDLPYIPKDLNERISDISFKDSSYYNIA